MQRFTSRIYWTCPQCDRANYQNVDVPELNFSAEKMSDAGTDDWVEIVCDQCETVYSGTAYVNASGTEFEIEEPHQFSFSGDIPMYEPLEEDYFPPEDPHSVAREALSQLAAMVGSQSPANDAQFTNRLIFAGGVSSLEAYLGDTLISAVQSELEVRNDILKNNKRLGDIKVSASELAADAEILKKRIVGKLRGILYHNLTAVTALYHDAFGLTLMPSKSERDILFQAMPKRHDCVHRNGRNQDGEKLNDFTDSYVHEVLAAITKVIDHIERERTKDLPF